ncbi:hypothetical protein [Gilliamella apicola]|uniref:hypothetical protein n=1 Tax=Gilliamella apicola TaxID=1196095 RepID=UPI000A01588E|nr:hypothetical protein [Gilliamella apicola]ORF45452.1 hypothetical protein B5800_07640 [Gilliamella apicola]ORF47402.1 hypothetical protein B5799_12730 [Gilliamella apicola]ORF49608.1 hypothetical protein B5803_10285 [Gilliamella apicola]ORF52903.1 hypothetical protein B5802_09470 [Gilliamella apicola]ORF53963.1 hypothetical protein B5798_07870 [Gilliamella apicola]
MKRIALLGVVCFALFGCGEKKVTEEMLVGDWECRQNKQKAKWKNGTFQDFGEVKSEKVLITYKNYDGMLMKGRGDDIAKGNWSSVSSIIAMQDVKNLSISELFRHIIYLVSLNIFQIKNINTLRLLRLFIKVVQRKRK